MNTEMIPRERVKCVFEHREPDRVPAWCGADPAFWRKAKQALDLDDEALRVRFHDDFRQITAPYRNPQKPESSRATWRTPFGVERYGTGYGLPLAHPLAKATLEEIHNHAWPDPGAVDVSGLRKDAARHQGRYAILGGDWSPFWHDVMDLVGMENLFYLMYDAPETVDVLFDYVTDYYYQVNRRIFEIAGDVIDIFFFGNDFGGQNGPLLSEKLFRRFVFPHLTRSVQLSHDYDLKAMMHCCGGIAPLIPAMIETGLDGLQAIQPTCRGMDLAALKAKYGDQIVFNGAIDSQKLIEGSASEVAHLTIRTLETMKSGGGYIASASHNAILEETPLENVLAMFDTIHQYGVYD